jgi:hypothetical protein
VSWESVMLLYLGLRRLQDLLDPSIIAVLQRCSASPALHCLMSAWEKTASPGKT